MDFSKFLILFQAQIKGDKAVKKSLEEMNKKSKKLISTSGGLEKGYDKLSKGTSRLSKRQLAHQNMLKQLSLQGRAVNRMWGENARLLGKSITKTKDGYRVTSTYTNGQKQLNRTLNVSSKGFKKTNSALRETSGALKTTAPLMDQMVTAFKRVAVVLPVWFAARQVMMGFIKTIQEGSKYLYDFNKAFTKASLVVHTVAAMSNATAKLKEDFSDLAKIVGESGTEIAKSFYRFGTLGIKHKTAWAGAQASIKQAVATYGDMDAIARSNALAVSLLGNTLEKNLSIQERMNLLSAKQVVLWKTNLMESTEFAGALERFLPTAKTLNFTLDQTIALLASLHSAGIRGTRAGRTLSTSMLKFIENLDSVGREIGVVVREGDDMFGSLSKVLDVFSKMYNETHGKLSPELNRLFKEIFGGVRSQRTARALVAMNKVLKENFDTINTMGGTSTDKINKLTEAFKNQTDYVLDSYSKLIDKMKQIKKEIGESLVKGFQKALTGTTDERDAIIKLNKVLESFLLILKKLEKMSPVINALLTGLGVFAVPATIGGIKLTTSALKNLLKYTGLTSLAFGKLGGSLSLAKFGVYGLALAAGTLAINLVALPLEKQNKLLKESAKSANKLADGLKSMADVYKSIETPEDLKKFKKLIDDMADGIKKTVKSTKDIGKYPMLANSIDQATKTLVMFKKEYNKLKKELIAKEGVFKPKVSADMKKQLELLEKSQKYINMEMMGYSSMEVSQQKLNDYLSIEVNHWNEIVKNAKETKQENAENLKYVTMEEIETALISNNYIKIKESLNYTKDDEKKILEMKKRQLAVIKEQHKAVKKYSSDLQSTFQKSLSELFQGKIDTKNFYENIQNKISTLYSDAITKNITTGLEKSTGIFKNLGKMFAGLEFQGTMGEPIVKASDVGAKKFYNSIVSASSVGARIMKGGKYTPGAGGGYAGAMGYGGYTGGVGTGGAIPGWLPFGNKLNTFFGGGLGGYRNTTIQSMGSRMGYPTKKAGMGLGSIGLSSLAMGAMTGNWQQALTGGIGMALTAVNPILGLGFMLVSSLFGGGKKKTVRDTSWKNPQIAKNLMPFLGISPAPMPSKTYAMPSSHYFVSNVTIHVDKITGERPDIVNEISKNVSNVIEEQAAKQYYHNMLRSIRPSGASF